MEKSPYEGQEFKVLGYGKSGDARIRLPNGKTCFVNDAPKDQRTIRITRHREGRGNADFATYLKPEDHFKNQGPAEDVYMLHMGPTKRGDDSAIAVCDKTILEMNAYEGLVYLIKSHENDAIFTSSTDRRIAKGLHSTHTRLEKDKALNELILTLEDEPVVPETEKTLESYFRRTNTGKYRAVAVVSEGEEEGAAVAPPQPEKPQVFHATATAVHKGSPG